jgi:hypothetical protein
MVLVNFLGSSVFTYAPAVAFSNDSSPTPNVVTTAEMPLTRA